MLALLQIRNKFYFLVLLLLFLPLSWLNAFSFSEAEAEDELDKEEIRDFITEVREMPCSKRLLNKKIAVIIGEKREREYYNSYSKSSGVVNLMNSYLNKFRLKTYSPEQIKRQIANAEAKAYLSGDMDAALNAAKRLSANFLLKGLITIKESKNQLVKVNDVIVHLHFTLENSRGKTVAVVDLSDSSYAGSDTYSVVLDIIKEQGELAVAKLYKQYCSILK